MDMSTEYVVVSRFAHTQVCAR